MAANTDTTRIIIDLESRIRNLERTLRGLDQLKKRLDAIGGTKTSTQGADRAVLAAQKLALQQQKLILQSQELANRQEKARQVTERLAQAQTRLAQAQERATRATQRPRLGSAQDTHVKEFQFLEAQRRRQHQAAERVAKQAEQLAQREARARIVAAKQTAAETAKIDRRATAAANASQKKFEAEIRRRNQAAESLQKQRSQSIIKQFRDQEREQERARKSVLTLDQALSRVGGSLRNLGLGLTSLGSSLSLAVTAPLAALGVIATQNAVTLDSLKRGLVAITGSAAEAEVQFGRLTEIAKLPCIGFQEAIQGSIRLQAVGFSAEVAERALIQFSNAVALTGGGRDELNRITVQLGQLSAKGKVLSQDLKPIIEAGPAVGRALKEAFGTVNAEDIQALGLSSEQFLDRLIKQLEKLPRAAGGARNTFDNFADAMFRATASIGNAILPVLTRLINFAEPIITAFANGFRTLPPVIQVLVIAFGGLAAAAGPALFILGQFATGIGGLISAFGRLHALGLLPTIKGFQLLAQVMRGTASLAAGQAATAAAAAAGWIALAGTIVGVVAILGLVVAAIAAYSTEQEKATDIDLAAAKDRQKRIASLKEEVKFLERLAKQTEATADQQQRLLKTYEGLDRASRGRVELIEDETEKLQFLIEAKRKQLQIDEFSARATSAQVVKNLTLALQEQAKAEADLAQAKNDFNNATLNAARSSGQFGARTTQVSDILEKQEAASLKAAKALEDIGKAGEKVKAAAQVVEDLGVAADRSVEVILQQARAAGVDAAALEKAREAIQRFVEEQRAGIVEIDAFTKALEQQTKEVIKAGEAADAVQKGRRDLIQANVSVAREASDSFQGALANLRAFIAAQPDLRAALEKEAQLAGKSFDEFVREALGERTTSRAGTSLRNAQEQLAKAVEQVAEASAARQRSIERSKNEDLLQQNENNYRLQLIAFRQYVRQREFLTRQNLELEIREQEALHTRALAEQERFLARSRQAGIPAGERTRAVAEAAEAEQKAIETGTRILNLRAEQARVTVDANQDIAEAAKQQIEDIRKLDIEFAELRGSIEDALNTATIEKFRERLLALGKAQEDISIRLEGAIAIGPEEVQRLELARQRNQSEIDLIELITQQELATNKLAAANEFVRRAKETQSDLETELAFEVEFRGLKEEEAIKRRLEGEQKLADSLRVVRDLVQAEVEALQAKGVQPPQALIEFVRDTSAAIKGLGELPFNEQFRLVEKEFNRLNDERLQKIEDIERAVRERDIAEAEGLLIIRRINGQYSADLEEQVRLLKEIAAASNDASLQRQAQAAEQTAKDANSQLADFNRQLRSTSIDALQDGFTGFFASIGDRSRLAKEKLLDLIDSVVARINQVIAENLSEKLIESLFGGGDADEGIIAAVGRLFGLGGRKGAAGGVGDVAGGVTQTVETTAAATALTTGATAAATALTTGGVTAGATLVTSLTAAATSFSAAVIAAGTAFAATVAAVAASQTISQSGAAAARFIGGGATGLYPAVPGGAYRFVEGGYPEAVITTDPRHAARQVNILRELIARTKGFYGRIHMPDLAVGGIVSRETAEANMLNSINRASSFSPQLPDAALETAAAQAVMNLRITNQVSAQALVEPYLSSEAGVRHIKNIISQNSNDIARRLPIRRN